MCAALGLTLVTVQALVAGEAGTLSITIDAMVTETVDTATDWLKSQVQDRRAQMKVQRVLFMSQYRKSKL